MRGVALRDVRGVKGVAMRGVRGGGLGAPWAGMKYIYSPSAKAYEEGPVGADGCEECGGLGSL